MARILVIDDDPGMRKALKSFLERSEYEVSVASDGRAALNLHQACPMDLIITDILMPEKDGFETIIEFQQHFPRVKIIAISGGGEIGENTYLDCARAMGAEKAFAKPFKFQELLKAVRELLFK